MRHRVDAVHDPRPRTPLRRIIRPSMTSNLSHDPTQTVHWADDARRQLFDAWLGGIASRHGLRADTVCPASSDASFRRYLRIAGGEGTFIIMDAPPVHEDVRPFVQIAELMLAAGLHAPRIVEQDPEHGFLLLSDLGNRLYLGELQAAVKAGDTKTIADLMHAATSALITWQQLGDA